MPFQTLETYKTFSRLTALCLVLCTTGAAAFAQDDTKPPSNQREYDSAQRAAFVKIQKIEGLLTEKMVADYVAISKDYNNIKSTGLSSSRNAKQLAILKSGLEYSIFSLSELSVQEDPRELENYTKSLERDIGRAGSLIGNADDRKRFRQAYFQLAMPLLEQLLESNYLARSIAMEVMLSMEVVSRRGTTRMQMFEGIDKVLVGILKDPNQPDAVKIRAANSAKRYIQKAEAIPQIENALALAMIAELKRKFVGVPYQNSILMALERVHAPTQVVGKRAPIVLCAAVEVMSDTSQHIRTRCRAARLAGQQVGFDKSVNWDPIAWKISEVTLEASLLYSQAKNQSDVEWKYCGWYLYTAFSHEDRRGKDSKRGLANRAPKSEVVAAAMNASFDSSAYLMFRKGKLVSAIAKLDAWITKNRPANLVYSAACAPIKAGGQAAASQPGG